MEDNTPNGYYPIVIQLKGRHCLVVGGGRVAERKLRGLVEAGADRVSVISPEGTSYIKEMADRGRIHWQRKRFQRADLTGVSLVIAATDQNEINEEITGEAEKLGILSSNAGSGVKGSFITPSVMRRDELLIAVTTSGASPSLSILIKKELEDRYGDRYLGVMRRLRQLRKLVIALVEDETLKEAILLQAAKEAMDTAFDSMNAQDWMNSLLERMNGRQHK
ncbi:bifunctional precorrin-2 dehydrogenase/sirohydrochlorin ferrochelatase [Paenibacillus sp. L3-i20]|uniref:precorrin-2 dehydrogenase/sirohydrochlorin ferrochelatase family protein n=1 Tax=Paenibacillus sp. L3-i20 TaxID=2905833 RepID=UPI001EE0D394|nr:bifunctional precorrin-2 dehydrogenase/sirohydrochlorin ferrochelatase [Paenibacillus sp. L3-i20]GKU75736.1 precorrin-2 dehydrogenase [Paenibacillus sp. L3-i20]